MPKLRVVRGGIVEMSGVKSMELSYGLFFGLVGGGGEVGCSC